MERKQSSEQGVHEVSTLGPQMPSDPATQPVSTTELIPQNPSGHEVTTEVREDRIEEIIKQLSIAEAAIAERDAQIKDLRELEVKLRARFFKDYDRIAKELFLATDDIITIVRVRGPIGTDVHRARTDIRFPADYSDVIEVRTSRTDAVGKAVPDSRKFRFNYLFNTSASNGDLFERVSSGLRPR